MGRGRAGATSAAHPHSHSGWGTSAVGEVEVQGRTPSLLGHSEINGMGMTFYKILSPLLNGPLINSSQLFASICYISITNY